MNLGDVEKALEGLRSCLKKDGADLVIQTVDGDRIELALVLGESSCLECIVGSEMIIAKARMALSKIAPNVPEILLHDPRNKEKHQ